VEAVFNSTAVTADLFMATLAALELLDGANPAEIDKTPAAKYVLPLLMDEKRSSAVRAQALRLVAPNDPALDTGLLKKLLTGSDALLKQETVQTLQLAPANRAAALLLPFAAMKNRNPNFAPTPWPDWPAAREEKPLAVPRGNCSPNC